MTEKLYYADSHMVTFSASVIACEKVGEYYEAVLDRTAFFPEGGGQYADTGKIDGIDVIDVQERDHIIYHKMTGALEAGKSVCGEIDWKERFSKMQQHSGEHIVSGLVHAKFGYDNVGFHMGKDAITMDFNGSLTKEDLKEIERKANEIVVSNLAIQTEYPERDVLEQMEYRSKIEIEGEVRIVTIPGVDCCACCAPHVKRTGEIGLVKLLGVQNYKGGVRVSMLCGFRALTDYAEKSESVKQISVLLSAKEQDVFNETVKLKEEIAFQKNKYYELQKQMLDYKVNQIEERQPIVLLFEEELEGNAPRELVNLLLAKQTRIAAVFSGTQENGYRYVIGSKDVDVRVFAKGINEKFQGKGGGKSEMVQGTVYGNEQEIRKEVMACSERV